MATFGPSTSHRPPCTAGLRVRVAAGGRAAGRWRGRAALTLPHRPSRSMLMTLEALKTNMGSHGAPDEQNEGNENGARREKEPAPSSMIKLGVALCSPMRRAEKNWPIELNSKSAPSQDCSTSHSRSALPAPCAVIRYLSMREMVLHSPRLCRGHHASVEDELHVEGRCYPGALRELCAIAVGAAVRLADRWSTGGENATPGEGGGDNDFQTHRRWWATVLLAESLAAVTPPHDEQE